MVIETQKDMRKLQELQKVADSWGGTVGGKDFMYGVEFARSANIHKRGIQLVYQWAKAEKRA